jgi:hypothetical protein
MQISQEVVKELFDYHEDGFLIWKKQISIRSPIGKIVAPNSFYRQGYRKCSIEGKKYKQHSLIFLWHHGYIPKTIDHEDTDRANNKITNLRPATQGQQCMNRSKIKGKDLPKGVNFRKKQGKFSAQIKPQGKKRIWLGTFNTMEEAHEAYKQAAIKHFGEFARY